MSTDKPMHQPHCDDSIGPAPRIPFCAKHGRPLGIEISLQSESKPSTYGLVWNPVCAIRTHHIGFVGNSKSGNPFQFCGTATELGPLKLRPEPPCPRLPPPDRLSAPHGKRQRCKLSPSRNQWNGQCVQFYAQIILPFHPLLHASFCTRHQSDGTVVQGQNIHGQHSP